MNQTKLLQMLDGHLSTMLKHLHQLLEADRRFKMISCSILQVYCHH
jgi:hypothetical protein